MNLLEFLRLRLTEESAKHVNKLLVKSDKRNYKCAVDNCDRQGYAGGYCNAHYIRFYKGLPMDIPIRNRKKDDTCSICGIKTNTKGGWGMCQRHYGQLRNKIIKETLVEYFGGRCADCGKSYPIYCFDFHHLNGNRKEYAVGNMLNICSIEKIANETIKCELLCSNCHRIKHAPNELSV